MTYSLNNEFLDSDQNKDSIREGFGRGIVRAAEADERIVALTADLTSSVGLGEFAEKFPNRFVQVGIAEQNLVTVASGMAHVGKIPYAASYAAFSPGRNWEQIRTTICLNNMPVKVVGSHAGVNVGPDGATHQMLEDIALMRVLPRMVVIAPGDVVEAEKAAQVIAQDNRPTYIRLPREKSPVFLTDEHKFEIGKAYILREGSDITIAATGTMTAQALIAASDLEKQGIFAEIIHVPTIKPLDKEIILSSAQKTGCVFTVEEHQIAGGFGSTVMEILFDLRKDSLQGQTQQEKSIKFHRIGINDEFGQSGTADELLDYYGLTAKHIVAQTCKFMCNVL